MPRQNQARDQERTDQSASRAEDYEECLCWYANLFLDHSHQFPARPQLFVYYRLMHALAVAVVLAQEVDSLSKTFRRRIKSHVLQSSQMHVITDHRGFPWFIHQQISLRLVWNRPDLYGQSKLANR